jgi:acyl-CoA synthetase (AMP-forming)/AMP-acid ligase II
VTARTAPADAGAHSVVELLTRTASRYPDRPAVIDGGTCWSYADLHEAASTAARGLQRAGVRAGDPVTVAFPNGAHFFIAFFGALIAGAIAVPVFPWTTPERLRTLTRLADASAMVVSEALAASVSAEPAGPAVLTLADLERGGSPTPVAADPQRPCYIQYTSGSTADPRGAVITHAGLTANIAQMTRAMDISREDIFVSWLPTYHDMGLTLMALTPFSVGARVVLLPTDLRDVAGWLRAIEAHRGTFTAGPDFAYRLCLRNVRDPDRFDLSSLQVCMNAAEPVRFATLAGFESAFGLRRVMMTGYGLAEATLSVTCTERGQPVHADDRGLVCLGRPMPGTTVRIVGSDDLPVPACVPGEIVVGGPSTCAGYHRNPAATAALAWRDGFIRTGDLGYLDHEGRLFFTARRKDVINLAGRTLYPQEIEAIAEQVRGVRLAAAVGIDRGGAEGEQLHVLAEVRAADTAAVSDLQDMSVAITRAVHDALGVRPRSTLLLRPRRIPMTANGKVRRAALRQAVTDGTLGYGTDIIFPPPVRPASA